MEHAEPPAPAYLPLLATGELEKRAETAYARLASCTLCPRRCGVNRLMDERGFCRSLPVISSYGPHFGEEPPLVGTGGSGAIFVTHCNLACIFCQNYDISQCGRGQEVEPATLAAMMIQLQQRGCHNINIVTPSHIVPQLIRAVALAAEQGLAIPLVYNSGGYDAVETLRFLDGIVDIYMPDTKYGSNNVAAVLSHVPDYVDRMMEGIREMHRQVGDLTIVRGVAIRGLIIRHLVLPANLSGGDHVLPWIAREISTDTYVNIMDQYHWPQTRSLPDHLLNDEVFRELIRPVTAREYTDAIRIARTEGLHRGFVV